MLTTLDFFFHLPHRFKEALFASNESSFNGNTTRYWVRPLKQDYQHKRNLLLLFDVYAIKVADPLPYVSIELVATRECDSQVAEGFDRHRLRKWADMHGVLVIEDLSALNAFVNESIGNHIAAKLILHLVVIVILAPDLRIVAILKHHIVGLLVFVDYDTAVLDDLLTYAFKEHLFLSLERVFQHSEC